MKDGNEDNYEVVVTPVKFQTNKRGNSEVYKEYHENISSTRLRVIYDNLSVEIIPAEGIPYSYNAVSDGNGGMLFTKTVLKRPEDR